MNTALAALMLLSPMQETLFQTEKGLAPLMPSSAPSEIRVQIFPHVGAFTTPQGRETATDRFTLNTTGGCQVSEADDNLVNPGSRGPVLREGASLDFGTTDVIRPLLVTCSEPATLVRMGQKAYKYGGRFLVRTFTPTPGRKSLQVVNILPFEEYLRGVVPSESIPTWPRETLKAQSVAARTYSLFKLGTQRSILADSAYDVDDTVQDQVYLGLSTAQPATDEAIAATRGEVLMSDATVAKAFFSADSGGYTEDAEEVWAEEVPYCQAKPEVYDLSLTPKTFWTMQLTLADLNLKLRNAALIPRAASVTGVEVLSEDRNRSGRARSVQLTLADRSRIHIPGPKLRYALKLRSTLFEVSSEGGSVTFSGRGFGHAVGMSQVGAKVLAESLGWDYRQILTFYYTGVELIQIQGK